MESVEIVNLHGLARELKLSAPWLLQQAKAGRIPCLKADDRFVFNVDAVRAALAEWAGRERISEPERAAG